MKRNVKICIISDVHLGTYGCHADLLLDYLKSINPEVLILNGDIIDIWQFSKNYWPKSHMNVLNHLLVMIAGGVRVHYITGNHDELLRRFTDFSLGNFSLSNKLILNVPGGKKAWFFHGDVFDVTMKNSKWPAKLGGKGYDTLILINRFLNHLLEKTGRDKISLSKKVKDSVKRAVKFISDFETTAVEMAIYHGYDFVICGHIHQPKIMECKNERGRVMYLNSGDWVENCTALEFDGSAWHLHKHDIKVSSEIEDKEEVPVHDITQEFFPVLDLLKSIV
jgi:UDP-2,3-diacylglucosamine pyrophosphatase LpxH